MADLLTIGEFATATWLSPKALRLYDRNGLLSPDSVDPINGYRKYSPNQVETARLISMLRRIDMSLSAIGDLLMLAPEERAGQIADYREMDAEHHARRQSLARFLEHAARHDSLDGDQQPVSPQFEVGTRSVPATSVLTSTRHTSAKELPEVIRSCADRLFSLAQDRGGAADALIVIYHGQVGWESDGPIEVCVPVKLPERAHRVEPAHRELHTHVPREDVQFPRILGAFDAVRTRAVQLGLTPAGPPREVYTLVEHGRAPRCEVALPIQTEHG